MLNKIKSYGVKLGVLATTVSVAVTPYLAKATLEEDMGDIASTVGNAFQSGATTVLTVSLPYLIPVVLLFACFYFIWRKLRGAIR